MHEKQQRVSTPLFSSIKQAYNNSRLDSNLLFFFYEPGVTDVSFGGGGMYSCAFSPAPGRGTGRTGGGGALINKPGS